MTTTYRRRVGSPSSLAAAAIGLAACSSSSSPPGGQGTSSPTVASVPPSDHRYDDQRSQRRKHYHDHAQDRQRDRARWTSGLPACAATVIPTRPTRSSIPTAGSTSSSRQGFSSHQFGEDLHNVTGTCSQYLAAAQRVLRVEFPAPAFVPDEALLVQYADCMRTNGVPNYPDPTGDTTNFEWHQHEQPDLRERQQRVRQADQCAGLVDQRLGSTRRHQFFQRTNQRPPARRCGAGHWLTVRRFRTPAPFDQRDRADETQRRRLSERS